MVNYMARDGYYMAFACGVDLTQWDNAQVALAEAELNALDWFYSANVAHTKPLTQRINPMTSTHYPRRVVVGKNQGNFSSVHYLQTGILTYAVMGACTTAGAYTHAITKDTDEIPPSFAFHFEKEGTTANRRKDCLGVVSKGLDISVSERAPMAMQTYNADFAFTGAGGNLAQPAPLTQAANRPYTWYDYKSAAGTSKFSYNSATSNIDVDIIDITMHIGWGSTLFGVYDLNGYATNGLHVPPFDCSVELGVRITDAGNTALDTISDLVHTSYAGDLDLIIEFYESASRYLRFTWDKMYVVPDSYKEVFMGENDWFDGVRFRLEFNDENSSLAVAEANAIPKTSYEND